MNYGTRDISPRNNGLVQALMPPPPVTMAASTLTIQSLQQQVKQKDRVILALKAQNRSHLAVRAEQARQRELAKRNKGWHKHNANPFALDLYRSERFNKDDAGNINIEKVIFVTEYKFAMERVKEVNAEAARAEARVQILRAEQDSAHRKTRELIQVAEELELEVAREMRTRVAKSSPEDDQDTVTTDGESTDSHGDEKWGERSTAAGRKNGRLVLNPPKRERSLSMRNTRPTYLRLSQPKRERSVSVEGIQPTRLRLNPPKRKDGEGSPVPVDRKLSQPGATQVRKDPDKVRSGRVIKASAKTRR